MSTERLECLREADVIDAIASGRWPDRADAELRDHVNCCAICRDVAEVASAMSIERDASWAEATSIPSGTVVWMRIQARARADAARQAARPVAVMQALGFASAAGMISLLIGVIAWWVWSRTELLTTRTEWLTLLPTVPAVSLDTMGFAVRGVLLAIGLWLVLAPVAVYLAAADD